MTKALKPIRIGFIPLVDAAALFVVVDKGFAVVEGLDIQLAREVSWSNVRDKLNIGLFDAAHLLAPMAIASSLGLGCAKVPIITPFTLAVNGNAITVSPTLYADLQSVADGDLVDPVSSARALARVVRRRKESGAELMTFGMTFPFSSHNYLLRYWMASGGVDPDEDVRLIVLPPPYMVESLREKPSRWILCRRALELDRGRRGPWAHPPLRRAHLRERSRKSAGATRKRRVHGAGNRGGANAGAGEGRGFRGRARKPAGSRIDPDEARSRWS